MSRITLPVAPAGRNRTRRALRHTALLALATLLASCGHSGETPAPADLPAHTATLATVDSARVPRLVEASGLVQPLRQTTLTGRGTGPVIAVRVKAGDIVSEGQVLVEIQKEMNEGMLHQAEGALAQAEAAHTLAEQNFQRFSRLFERQACSQLELDAALMQRDQAAGAVKQAKGAVASARSVSDETRLRAPFRGRVVDTLVDLGDLAAPGRPLVILHSLEGSEFWITVPEGEAAGLAVGQPVEVALDSRSSRGRLAGSIHEVVPMADPATHSVSVRISLPESDLLAGSHGRAWLPAGERAGLGIPREAVYRSGGLDLVCMVDEQGLARTRAVTLGETRDGRVEVLSGLAAGQRVVSPLERPIAEGTPILEGQEAAE